MENNFWTECREVIQVGETICKDHDSLAYAHLCNTAAIIEYERGHGAEAWPYMKKALAIREDKWANDDPGHCDTYTNHALLLMTENASPEKFQEAEGLLREVIELAKPHHDKLHSVLHHHFTNLGVCLLHQGKYDDALVYVNKGMDNAFNEHFEAA
jgi:tetratricopeptide (TPR) repeat protein